MEKDIKSKKLTKWKEEPTLGDLKQDLLLASSHRSSHLADVAKWEDLYYVKGKAAPRSKKNRSSTQPKVVRKQAEWRIPSLTEPFHSSSKLFNVAPVTFEDVEAAKQSTLLLNWQFRTKLDRVELIDNIIRETAIIGTSIVRLGWHQEIGNEEVEVPVWEYYPIQDEESMQILQQAMEYRSANPRMYEVEVPEEIKAAVEFYIENEVPVQAVQVGTTVETREVVLANYPTINTVNINNIYVDPTCQGNIDKALYIINSYEVTKQELQASPGQFKNLDKIDWSANNEDSQHTTPTPKEADLSGSNRNRLTAYDYWGYYDIHGTGKLIPIVATWVGNVMVRLQENPYPDGKPPFVFIKYLPIKDSVYGEPDAELLEDNQQIVGAVTRGIIDVLGLSANGQIGIAKGMLDRTNKERFDNEQNYEFNPSLHPANNIINHVYPEIPNSAINVLSMQNNEAEAITGVKAFSGGLSGSAYGDVATAVRGVLDAASKREMAILRRIANGVKKVANKVIAMNAVFLTREEVIRVTNSEFIEITKEDIQGNFDLEVDIATAEIDDAKAQDLGFLLQTIGPVIDDPTILYKMIAEIMDLKRMPEFAEQLRQYRKEPSPQEQEMMELEMERVRLENEKLQSEVQLNQARAAQAQSDADMKDLNFTEQDQGIKHARDMEKQKGQAQGNMELEMLKAALASNDQAKGSTSPKSEVNYDPETTPAFAEDKASPISVAERDQWAKDNPALSLSSSKFDPTLDPALNYGMNNL